MLLFGSNITSASAATATPFGYFEGPLCYPLGWIMRPVGLCLSTDVQVVPVTPTPATNPPIVDRPVSVPAPVTRPRTVQVSTTTAPATSSGTTTSFTLVPAALRPPTLAPVTERIIERQPINEFITNTFVTNPTTIIRETIERERSSNRSVEVDFSGYVSEGLFDKQVDRIFDVIYDGNSDQAESFSTQTLTVGGNTDLTNLNVSGTSTLARLTADSIIASVISADSLFLPATIPANPASRLYNFGGDLYWNGSLIAGEAVGNWTTNGTGDAYRLSGNVGLGTSAPSQRLSVVGNIALTGTVDGRDVSVDGIKLDGVENGATADQTAAEIIAALLPIDGAGSNLDADTLDGISSATFALDTDVGDLSGVTDASTARTNLGLAIGTNVQAFDADLTTWAGVSSSANGRSLVSAANYAAMRGLLGVDAAGADNSTNVTLAGAPNYLTISGQTITRNRLDLRDDLNTFNSADLAGRLTNETGSGNAVFSASPVLSGMVEVAGQIFLNEGNGNAGIGSDIRFADTGLLSADNSFLINIDADNDATNDFFAISRNSSTRNAEELFRVQENGNVGIGTTAPSQTLDIGVGSMALLTTTSATSGIIFKGDDPFIHNFNLAGTDGLNTFVGITAGNFTMTGSTGTDGSYTPESV